MIERHYPVPERDWLRSKWAIHPPACSKCGTRKAVVWVLTVKREWWMVRCRACDPAPSVLVADFRVDGAEVLLLVLEVPAMLDRSDDAPSLDIAGASGHPLRAGILARVAGSFHELAKARLSWVEHPPVKWALERRDDGRVWAPWDPCGGWRRGGQALPLRSTVLREVHKRWRELHMADVANRTGPPCVCDICTGKPSPDRRKCWSCSVDLGADQTAWRVDLKGATNPGFNQGWSAQGKGLLWCPSCVSAVQVIAEAAPEETVVRHMRVIEGGVS